MSTVYDVAVVGSRGFLGSAVAAELDARGAVVSRLTKDASFTGDAATVVWAAGRIIPGNTEQADAAIADLRGLIDTALRSTITPHIVLLSSGGAVYGPPSVAPFSESEEPHPANAYGAVKLAEEQLLADSGLPHTVLRISNPYGPEQVAHARRARGGQGVVGHWLAAIGEGRPVTIFGDGTSVRDYVFIDDVAAAIATATEFTPGGIVNIGFGRGTSLQELLEAVTSAVAPQPVTVDRQPARGIDPPSAWLDVARAREVLGWEATTSLEDGLARTWREAMA